ncbi:hypothetical protein OFM39_36740, partial [Escherichia coli]|nr:hypothetical protein [Escherichia coli]
NLNKRFSYEKNQLISFEKKKKNVKKQHRYNLLSYNFIKYKDKKHSSIFGLHLQVNPKQYFLYNYNERKRIFFKTSVG